MRARRREIGSLLRNWALLREKPVEIGASLSAS
jgi:hypothetical protein